MKKTLVMVRHAHRNVDDRSKDNGLSDRGQDQIKKLLKFYKNRFENQKAVFFSSPKKRCQETLEPLLKETGVKLQIDERLDEQSMREGSALFQARIQEFLDVWKYEGEELTVICSHGDWIPYAVHELVNIMIPVKKCAWIEIEYEKGLDPALTWLVQKHY